MTLPAEAESASCEHYFASHVQGGRSLSVRICMLCRAIDWGDLEFQAAEIAAQAVAAEREKIRAAIGDEYGPPESSASRKMRRVLLGDAP